jgi:hypothetical protein
LCNGRAQTLGWDPGEALTTPSGQACLNKYRCSHQRHLPPVRTERGPGWRPTGPLRTTCWNSGYGLLGLTSSEAGTVLVQDLSQRTEGNILCLEGSQYQQPMRLDDPDYQDGKNKSDSLARSFIDARNQISKIRHVGMLRKETFTYMHTDEDHLISLLNLGSHAWWLASYRAQQRGTLFSSCVASQALSIVQY